MRKCAMPIPADRSQEPLPEPCATHFVSLPLDVRVRVSEGITEAHVFEYIKAHLENREADLHEDIWDELEGLTMHVACDLNFEASATWALALHEIISRLGLPDNISLIDLPRIVEERVKGACA